MNQYTGDGIMALFGAPIAHEDHAQRACYAALHLRDEIARYATEVKREHGVGFSTRMGLNSGEVVVGTDRRRSAHGLHGAGPHRRSGAAHGERSPSPDSCYLTAATAALVGGYFALEDLGDFRVKGVAEPVRVHRLAGIGAARTRFDISRARGLSRFVGRAADLRTLEDALEQTRRGQRPGGGRRGRGGHRQEPPVLRVPRALPRPRHARLRGPRRRPRPQHSVPADPRGVPRLLRHHARGRRSQRAREDRRAHGAARQQLCRRAAAALRLPRRRRSAAPGAAARPGGAPAPDHRRDAPGDPERQRGAADGDDGRGPALARRRQRRVPRAHGRRARRQPQSPAAQLPARVPRRLDAEVVVPADPADAARARGDRRAAGGSARHRSEHRRAGRPDPRAHRRQPVLHRRGGADADRVGASRKASAAPTAW